MPPRILIVEDEPSVSSILSRCLTGEGYAVEAVGNSVDALDRVVDSMPDLVLLDMQLPKVSGPELLGLLRQLRPGLRVVLMSGIDAEDLAQCAAELGAQGWLAKPVTCAQLLASVKANLCLPS